MWNRRIALVAVSGLLLMACGDDLSSDDTEAADVADQSEPEATEPEVTKAEGTESPRTSASVPETASPAPHAGPGCVAPHGPGEHEGLTESVSIAGTIRHPYTVVVPESIDPTVPAPIYLHLASGVGNRDAMLDGWRPQYAHTDIPGLMVVVGTNLGANSESLLALVDQLSDEFCVDASRIHVMGTSWSAHMAVDLACYAADRVASVSSGLGARAPYQSCDPERPVPLLSFSGDRDRHGDAALVAAWAELNGCDPEPATEELGSGVSHVVYDGCDAAVEFFDIAGMGHVWPLHDCLDAASPYCSEYEEVDYLEETLRFFEENPLP